MMIGCVLIFATFSVKQVILGAELSEGPQFNKFAESAVSAEGLYHWWPVWADKRTFNEPEQVQANGRRSEIELWDSEHRIFSVSPGEPATVRTAILFYPWWQVTVNGAEVKTKDIDGALAFDIGSENAVCAVTFREPSYTGISRVVSAISILVVMIFLLVGSFREKFSYE